MAPEPGLRNRRLRGSVITGREGEFADMDMWYKGMDISSLLEVEECGGKFFDRGQEKNALEILKDYGMNLVRLRLWNDPYDEDGNPYGAGTNDLSRTMILAGRVKKLGLPWLLDIHYSDFWVDPGKQCLPKAWKNYNEEELEEAVFKYTRDVLIRLRDADLLPEIVAVGNEVTNGLLWPFGKVPDYKNIVRFVNAGIRAVREMDERIACMIHLDNGGNNALYRSWFDQYFQWGGMDFEYIGLSYYPFWHGSLQDLENNMADIAMRYRKKLIVAEVSTAFTMEDYRDYEKLPDDLRKGMATKKELTESVPFPMTKQGQADFLDALTDVICRVPENLGCGFIYWEPAWLPVPGSQWANDNAIRYMNEKGPGGNEWANQALFDYDGNVNPALKVIRDRKVLSGFPEECRKVSEKGAALARQ